MADTFFSFFFFLVANVGLINTQSWVEHGKSSLIGVGSHGVLTRANIHAI